MACLASKMCTCRNCGNVQMYSYSEQNIPSTNESIAVCNKCGFKSVWYETKGMYDDIIKKMVEHKMPAVPLGIWDLKGVWHHNPKLSMSKEQQHQHNVRNGYLK